MGALQRDMKMLGDITICTGLKRYIACIEGSNLAITKAFWGRISDKVCPSDDGDPVTDCDGSEDTLPLVKGYCEGKRECKLEARHTLLQKNGTHHCPGVNKYLVVNYTCIPESKSVALCDSAETTLTCEAGWVIDIADIFWGRRSHAKYCGAEEGMECDSSDSAAKYIRSNCDGHRRCQVRADPALLDNSHSPCTTILKYLMINYVCKPPEKDPMETEMMGLLESHVPVASKASSQSTQTSTQAQQQQQQQQDSRSTQPAYSSQTGAATTSNSYSKKGKNKYFTSTGASDDGDELSKVLLGGVGLPVDSALTSKKQDVAAKKKPVVGAKRDDLVRKEKSQSVSGTKRDKGVEKPKMEADEGYYDDEFAKITSKSKSHEKPDSASVRSLLARAKEVLQTLGNDNSKFQSVLEKREHIPLKNATADGAPETPAGDVDAAKDLTLLTQSDLMHDLSRVEDKPADIVQQTAAAFNTAAENPNPDIVKKAEVAHPAAFGNTP